MGDRVAVVNANIEASSVSSGGNIFIGGDRQGNGIIPNASQIFVDANSTLSADGIGMANGGQVVLFAEENARIFGSLSVRGGELGGDGGFVETSGLRSFEIATVPDISAPFGSGGEWLIDPYNIDIVAGYVDMNIDTSTPFEFISSGSPAELAIGSIEMALMSGNVTIVTGSGGTEEGNIRLNAPLTFNLADERTLTLNAHNDILINVAIDGTTVSAPLNINLNGDFDANGSGRVAINNPISTLGGDINISGTSNVSGGVGITLNAGSLNAGGGNIILDGTNNTTGGNNFGILADSVTSIETMGTGNISLTGIAGDGINSRGIGFGGNITTVDGAITLNGTGGNSGSNTDGVSILTGATLTALGTGNISLTGVGGDNSSVVSGVFVGGDISTVDGSILIDGTAGNSASGNNFGITVGGEVSTIDGSITFIGRNNGSGGNQNAGISVFATGVVEALETGTISMMGTSGNGVRFNHGIDIEGDVRAVDGAIVLEGTGSGSGSDNHGVFVDEMGTIATTGTGDISLEGTGGNGTMVNGGIRLLGNVSTTEGSISANGTGGNAMESSPGITIAGIVSTIDGLITLEGMGGSSVINNAGIFVPGTIAATGTGSISLTGTGNDGVQNSPGISISETSSISTNDGSITINGIAGNSVNVNRGIQISGSISTNDGSIVLTGTGNGSGNDNGGIVLGTMGTIAATGTGDISLTGTGGNGTEDNNGIRIAGNVSAIDGSIALSGVGNGSGIHTEGLVLDGGSTIATTGSGDISLTGIAGNGPQFNGGIQMFGGATISTTDGSISMNGMGGNGDNVNPGIILNTVANENITWETTRIIDLGVDFSVFEGKLNLSVDYFDKTTRDILYNITTAGLLGLGSSPVNAGKVKNQGWDVSIKYRNTVGDFTYSFTPNFAIVNNEVLSLSKVEKDIQQGLFIGQPLNAIYGYVDDGLFVDEQDIQSYADQPYSPEPGDIKYKDISGPEGVPDGKVTAEYDRKVIGQTSPKYTYGGQLSAKYKSFDFSLTFYGAGGMRRNLENYAARAFANKSNVQQWMWDNRWTRENPDPNAIYPRFFHHGEGRGEPYAWYSTYWSWKASYMKIKSIQIGYNMPEAVTNTLNLEGLRIYLSGRNLYSFDNYYPGWDPEILVESAQGGRHYPMTRTYVLGVNVKF